MLILIQNIILILIILINYINNNFYLTIIHFNFSYYLNILFTSKINKSFKHSLLLSPPNNIKLFFIKFSE